MRVAAMVCTVMAAACGGEERTTPGTVGVTVLASGAPVAGVPVWFVEQGGTLALETKTNELGAATALVGDRGMVHVLTSYEVDGNPVPALRTFVETRTGDELVIHELSELPPTQGVRVELPAASGANSYVIRTPCSQEEVFAESATINLTGCADDVAFLVSSRVDEVAPPLGWLYVAPTAISDGAVVDLRAQSWAPFSTIPVQLSGFGLRKQVTIGAALVYHGFALELAGANINIVDGAATWTTRVTSVDETFAVVAHTESATFPPNAEESVVVWGPDPAALALDGAMLLPDAGKPVLDLVNRGLFWSSATGASLAEVELQLVAGERTLTWRIVAPSNGAAVAIPRLPPALAGYEPGPGVETSGVVRLIESSVGYDGLRARLMNRRAPAYIAGPEGHTVVRVFDL